MVVDASILQNVSTLHVVVTMLSVWQEHTASVCEAYWTIAVDSCTLVYFLWIFRLQLPLLCCVPATCFGVRASSAVRLRRCILRTTSLCSSCVWKSIVATVPADFSSSVLW